jgi:hypothetical protein
MKRLSFILLLAVACFLLTGQSTMRGPMLATAPTSAFNFTLFDYGTCTNASAPTTGCLGSSTYPGGAPPTGGSFTVTNTNTDLLVSNAVSYNWPTFSLTGGAWANNSSNSLRLAYGGTQGDNIRFLFPTSTVQATVSSCTPIYSTIPQGTSTSGRIDTWTLQNNSAGFTNMQVNNGGSVLQLLTECGNQPVSGNCVTYSDEVTNMSPLPTSTWEIMCEQQTSGASGTSYSAVWNTPQAGGALVANSLASSTANGTNGVGALTAEETQIGVSAGPAGYYSYFGAQIFCGLINSQTSCPFPLVPGLQLFSPTDSPGSGNYSGAQTVTVTDSPSTGSIYYTTCTSAGCTPSTPTTGSTLYSGSFTATPPEAVSYIAALANYVTSTVSTSYYVSPNAAYVGSAQCQAVAVASCTMSSLSIPSGDIIVVASESNSGTLTISDSHSDSPSYGTAVHEAADGFYARLGIMKAGATVTTITCTQSPTSNTDSCVAAWYSPGSLGGTVDQTAGQDEQNLSLWTSGNTAALAGASELVIGYWVLPFTGGTSTYSDGSTARINCSLTVSCALTDRTAWGTAATAASGTWNGTDYGLALVMAIQ